MAMLQGTAKWAKILGKPAKGYTPGETEWSIDIYIDDKTIAKLEKDGAGQYVKEDKNGVKFIKFVRKGVTRDGQDAKPFRVVDNKGQPWDQTKLIGNGSVVNVQYLYNELDAGKKTHRFKPSALAFQVWDHKAYEGGEEFPVMANDSEDWTENDE